LTSHLLPFSISANQVRLSHGEHKASGESARQFIRKHSLIDRFSSKADLKRAIELNELWLLTIVRADSVKSETIAASRYVTLVERDCRVAILDAELKVTPPLPRHEDIVLECIRHGVGLETWSMSWQEYPGCRYTVRSPSLREVMRRGLEISAGNAEGAFRAFDAWSIAH
jgi:hypothetical protein